MPKIFPAAIFISVLVVLSQFAKPMVNEYPEPEAGVVAADHQQNQFRLKESFPMRTENHRLLASVYSCGAGEKQKEVLSIWSLDSEAYELRHIRTAATGQIFLKPEVFSIEKMEFIKITARNRQSGQAQIDAVLSVDPDSNLHEVQSKQSRELIKIEAQS